MADPVGDIIGDYRAFVAQQHERLLARGIDIGPYPLSHLAVRVPEWDQYVHLRTLLERHAVANREKSGTAARSPSSSPRSRSTCLAAKPPRSSSSSRPSTSA